MGVLNSKLTYIKKQYEELSKNYISLRDELRTLKYEFKKSEEHMNKILKDISISQERIERENLRVYFEVKSIRGVNGEGSVIGSLDGANTQRSTPSSLHSTEIDLQMMRNRYGL